jgi:cytosine/adenosine deaminase-related metal-dependent hydrolase
MSAASAESVHPRIHLARRVITPAGPRRAVAVIGGLVAATGEPDELRARFPGAGETDHGDAVIAPGFRDAHMHPCLAAMSANDAALAAYTTGSALATGEHGPRRGTRARSTG